MTYLACCAAALSFVGCEHEAVDGLSGPEEEGKRPLRFFAMLPGAAVDVETRAEDQAEADRDSIKAKMTAARNAIEKRQFDWKQAGTAGTGDLIRVCNVESNSATPYFSLSLGDLSARTCEYECKQYIGRFPGNEGTATEDSVLGKEYLTYSEYEFVPHGQKGGFFQKDLVSYENKYMFYAMWRGSYRNDQSVESYIPSDQSGLDSLKTADIMLAYLSMNMNSEDSVRLFFRHSLCMIDVHLTLPMYTQGVSGDGGDEPPSGYRLLDVEAELTHIPVDFTISSSEATSSAAMVTVLPGNNIAEKIPMYKYFVEDETQTWQNPDAGHYERDNEDEEKESRYRTYGFCAIVPPMKWSSGNQTPLLRVKLKSPTGSNESYVYIPTESSTSSGSSNTFNLVQGNISVLEFKISRSMKDMMLVRAKIEPWTKAEGNLSFTQSGGNVQP